MFVNLIDILGTIAFAISGVMVALNKKLDLFGILIIAFVTSTGGGTLRDVLLGVRPIFWLTDTNTVYIIIATTAIAIIFRKYLKMVSKSLVLFDTIGIGFYTIAGIEKSLLVNLDPVICVAIGTISACFGGVIRDILCRRIPVIFKKEVYATACILGGVSFFALRMVAPESKWLSIVPILVVILVRIAAVRYKLTLPSLYKQKGPSF
ncbi:Uncharacterized membrane protein YeiH [Pustulibacterium marinum]|uniref:Uncharacterized membrane protein YeiH n=1 Tax=Pustulibacterium marinum TaxID=1224947 RepID=A0A1I7GAW4_9FLAO|nr:trimeric intracellular cation channel family protein [Pustulibacterium marinum]SFU45555.1 Uncharacterized membrane protein YeiH [Pustulibacterium marinum]